MYCAPLDPLEFSFRTTSSYIWQNSFENVNVSGHVDEFDFFVGLFLTFFPFQRIFQTSNLIEQNYKLHECYCIIHSDFEFIRAIKFSNKIQDSAFELYTFSHNILSIKLLDRSFTSIIILRGFLSTIYKMNVRSKAAANRAHKSYFFSPQTCAHRETTHVEQMAIHSDSRRSCSTGHIIRLISQAYACTRAIVREISLGFVYRCTASARRRPRLL